MATQLRGETDLDFLWKHAATWAWAYGPHIAGDYADWYVRTYGDLLNTDWPSHRQAWWAWVEATDRDVIGNPS